MVVDQDTKINVSKSWFDLGVSLDYGDGRIILT